jgi:hypothetical protein
MRRKPFVLAIHPSFGEDEHVTTKGDGTHMTKWLIAAAAIVIVAIPVASAASPKKTQKPASSAQSQPAKDNSAKACKAERASVGVEAFRNKYGTNKNKMNAFGKCVSGKAKTKTKKDDDDKADDSSAAKACKSERASMGVDAFAKKYGTNHNLKNAFGKCVSGKSKAKDKDD